MSNAELISWARKQAAAWRLSTFSNYADKFDGLANALEVLSPILAPVGPSYKTCPHGFIDWDFCPECCH